MINFETIYLALFNKVKVATYGDPPVAFLTTSRRLKHWSGVPSGEQPALFQIEIGIELVQQKGIPSKYLLKADLYIYAFNSDHNSTPAIMLNQLIAAVNESLAPDPATGFQTLGLESVSHCWIEGEIITDEGVLGDQAVAIVPINILAI